MRLTWATLKIFLALYLFCAPARALAGEPMAQLSKSIDEFVTILIHTPVAQLRESGLPENARKLIFERFDFSKMTQLTLGKYWTNLNTGEQKEFVDAFTQRLLVNYGRNVRSTGTEKIVYRRETLEGKEASVQTKVVSGNGDELPVDYQLHDTNGQWRVYDVTIDSVSIVNNFREQFQRVIARSSVQDLLKKMKEQTS